MRNEAQLNYTVDVDIENFVHYVCEWVFIGFYDDKLQIIAVWTSVRFDKVIL